MPGTRTTRPQPLDATLSVTRAAEVLGVHPNTVRAWSEAGRLRFYRINPRGDRRYRMSDLRRFLASTLAVEIDRGGQPLKVLRPNRHGEANVRKRYQPPWGIDH